jgi:hypothetical protein
VVVVLDTGEVEPFLSSENIDVRPTDQPFVPGRAPITAARSEARDDVWRDVFVCQEGKSSGFTP